MYVYKELTELFSEPLLQKKNCNLKCMEQRRVYKELNKRI
jgi:hypothetical protein